MCDLNVLKKILTGLRSTYFQFHWFQDRPVIQIRKDIRLPPDERLAISEEVVSSVGTSAVHRRFQSTGLN